MTQKIDDQSNPSVASATSAELGLPNALYALWHAIEQIEQVCSDLIDCNDGRLLQARGDLKRANELIINLMIDKSAR